MGVKIARIKIGLSKDIIQRKVPLTSCKIWCNTSNFIKDLVWILAR